MFYSWQISLNILLNVYWVSFLWRSSSSYPIPIFDRLGGSCLFLDCLSFYYEIVEAFSTLCIGIFWQTCELKHLLIICDFLFYYLLMIQLPDFKTVHLSTGSFMVSAFVFCVSKLFQNRCHKDILLCCLQKALFLSFTFRATIYLNMILYIYIFFSSVLKVTDQDFILPYKYQIDSAHWIMDWSVIQKGIFSLATPEGKLWYIYIQHQYTYGSISAL